MDILLWIILIPVIIIGILVVFGLGGYIIQGIASIISFLVGGIFQFAGCIFKAFLIGLFIYIVIMLLS